MKRSPEETAAFLEANRIRMLQNPTEAEAKLWPHLEKLGFQRQCPILAPAQWPKIQDRPYILDFFHAEKQLCIEVDGSAHHFRQTRDRKRDNKLQRMGIRTIRISNRDVLKHIEEVLLAIKAALEPD